MLEQDQHHVTGASAPSGADLGHLGSRTAQVDSRHVKPNKNLHLFGVQSVQLNLAAEPRASHSALLRTFVGFFFNPKVSPLFSVFESRSGVPFEAKASRRTSDLIDRVVFHLCNESLSAVKHSLPSH